MRFPKQLIAVSVIASTVALGLPAAADVLLAGPPDNPSWLSDVQAKIAATGRVSGNIDTFDTSSGTPTAEMLAQYDAVLTFTDRGSQDPDLLGDRLADFVDAGGGVVQATFSWLVPLGGRWRSGGYSPLTYAGQSQGIELFIGTRHLPGHQVLSDVDSFSGGTASFHNTGVVAPGATPIADWTNGAPLVAEMGGMEGRIIGLNFYPPSSDARADLWRTSTDGDLLLANALVYTIPEPCDPCDMNCDGEINALDIEDFIDLLFNGGEPCNTCTGDVNGDGSIDALDIEPFLECLFP